MDKNHMIKMDNTFHEDYMLFMLNTLGQTYNYSLKFNINNRIMADMRDAKFINFVNESFNQDYMVKNHEGYNLYDLSEIKTNDALYFEKKYLEEQAQTNVVYDFVRLKSQNKCPPTILSSLSKWDNINIDDILYATSKMITDKNKVVVDFKYNRRNKYKKIKNSGYHSILLQPGFID